MADEKKKMNRGGRNLILLGMGAIGLAILATSLSIWIYYETGDIYIDRSRPGFLPEEEEVEEESESDDEYEFSENGEITAENLDEYLEHLQTEVDKLDAIKDTFGSSPLTDESLGIPDDDVEASSTSESETSE